MTRALSTLRAFEGSSNDWGKIRVNEVAVLLANDLSYFVQRVIFKLVDLLHNFYCLEINNVMN